MSVVPSLNVMVKLVTAPVVGSVMPVIDETPTPDGPVGPVGPGSPVGPVAPVPARP